LFPSGDAAVRQRSDRSPDRQHQLLAYRDHMIAKALTAGVLIEMICDEEAVP
jgi:hypothetical protein